MHISFLIHHAYGVGGTIRTTLNLARVLAEQHDVEVVSVFRRRERPCFDPGPRVRLRHLVDDRPGDRSGGDRPDARARPSRLFPRAEGIYRDYSALTDQRIDDWLRSSRADVLVGTRPGLNTQLALRSGHGPAVVGQQHVPLASHTRGLRLTVRDAYPLLHGLVTVTEADALDCRARIPLRGVRLAAVPNPVPAPATEPADGTGRFVVAAGRLVPVKGYDVLLRAFSEVAAQRPDWGLRIYGRGGQRAALRSRIEALGLGEHAHLMGTVHPLDPEWVKGSVAVSTSRVEAFGMSIVEAMRCGLPTVATRCPHGPGEVITDGGDGRLVPVDDASAIAEALLELIGDAALRRRMGQAALANAGRFDPARIAERYSDLFTELTTTPPAGERRLHRARGAVFRGGYAGWDTLRRTARDRVGPRAGAANADH